MNALTQQMVAGIVGIVIGVPFSWFILLPFLKRFRNVTKRKWTLRQIRGFEAALDALREEIAESNPTLFAVTSKAYERRLRDLRDLTLFLDDD